MEVGFSEIQNFSAFTQDRTLLQKSMDECDRLKVEVERLSINLAAMEDRLKQNSNSFWKTSR